MDDVDEYGCDFYGDVAATTGGEVEAIGSGAGGDEIAPGEVGVANAAMGSALPSASAQGGSPSLMTLVPRAQGGGEISVIAGLGVGGLATGAAFADGLRNIITPAATTAAPPAGGDDTAAGAVAGPADGTASAIEAVLGQGGAASVDVQVLTANLSESSTVLVRGLPWWCTETALFHSIRADAGAAPRFVRILEHPANGVSLGAAVVDMPSPKDAHAVLEWSRRVATLPRRPVVTRVPPLRADEFADVNDLGHCVIPRGMKGDVAFATALENALSAPRGWPFRPAVPTKFLPRGVG
eukprot:TRINITY_DN47396_c0_g1_i1.p1 TRINITY_DN47396_c0_g1~~TRINITY_DN47396_c0_g1_i1.p1  ORF type:complete len:296 (-),score=52.17 TRINITY_DN47396_c0_g1_i1:110-997(-)